MSRRITDDELARLIVGRLRAPRPVTVGVSAYTLASELCMELGCYRDQSIRRRLRALRDEGRVVEVAGPRGSLWRLP